MKAGDSYTRDGVTVRKTKDAQPAGEYTPTGIDAEKAAADFRITSATRKGWVIEWRDGRTERVTDARLGDLQASHTWSTDF